MGNRGSKGGVVHFPLGTFCMSSFTILRGAGGGGGGGIDPVEPGGALLRPQHPKPRAARSPLTGWRCSEPGLPPRRARARPGGSHPARGQPGRALRATRPRARPPRPRARPRRHRRGVGTESLGLLIRAKLPAPRALPPRSRPAPQYTKHEDPQLCVSQGGQRAPRPCRRSACSRGAQHPGDLCGGQGGDERGRRRSGDPRHAPG